MALLIFVYYLVVSRTGSTMWRPKPLSAQLSGQPHLFDKNKYQLLVVFTITVLQPNLWRYE